MYVCMYLCMYDVCVYACVHVCLYVCVLVYTCVCMHVCMYLCIYVCMCMYGCTYMCGCMYVFLYCVLCVYVGMYYLRMCVCIYLCMWPDNKVHELIAVKVLHTSLLNTTVVVFKVVPLGSYSLMPAPSLHFKTILDLVLWNGLQNRRCITPDVIRVIKMPSFQYFL